LLPSEYGSVPPGAREELADIAAGGELVVVVVVDERGGGHDDAMLPRRPSCNRRFLHFATLDDARGAGEGGYPRGGAEEFDTCEDDGVDHPPLPLLLLLLLVVGK